MTVTITDARSPEELEQVRVLWREFRTWLEERYQGADRWLLGHYFSDQDWEEELRGLPGAYAPSERGALVLAMDGRRPIGAVALRSLDASVCEMKRMYVSAAARGRGAARLLVEELIERGRALGHARMVLDTGFRQFEAEALYRSCGFAPSEPPYAVDERLAREGLTFLARNL